MYLKWREKHIYNSRKLFWGGVKIEGGVYGQPKKWGEYRQVRPQMGGVLMDE